MNSKEQIYGPFRSEETYEIIGFDYENDESSLKEVDEVLEEVSEDIDRDTYEDLEEIYGEEQLEGLRPESHLEDISDGIGCTEIWEKMSERRAQD
jgi:hypothetical protein